jgi:hypothetical protein
MLEVCRTMSDYALLGFISILFFALSYLRMPEFESRLTKFAASILLYAYGCLNMLLPVAILGFLLMLLNVFYIVRYARHGHKLAIYQMNDNRYLDLLLEKYHHQINRLFPDFFCEAGEPLLRFLILRDTIPAGIFIACRMDEQTLFVELDFVFPLYRNFSIGNFLYRRNQRIFTDLGFTRLQAYATHGHHSRYLRLMGFHQTDKLKDRRIFVKELLPVKK